MIKKNNFQIISNKQARQDPLDIEDSDSQNEENHNQEDVLPEQFPEFQQHEEEKEPETCGHKINLDQVVRELDEEPKRLQNVPVETNYLKAIIGKKLRKDKVLYLVEKHSDIKQWKESEELFDGGYGDEIQAYERFLKERIEIALIKFLNEKIEEQQCFYFYRHYIRPNNKIELFQVPVKGNQYPQKYEQFDNRIEKRFLQVNRKRFNSNSNMNENFPSGQQQQNIRMPLQKQKQQNDNEKTQITKRSNRSKRNLESSSEEVLPKQTQQAKKAPVNMQVMIKSHETNKDGQTTFLVKLEYGEKKMASNELEEKYPKELAMYLYDIINNS